VGETGERKVELPIVSREHICTDVTTCITTHLYVYVMIMMTYTIIMMYLLNED